MTTIEIQAKTIDAAIEEGLQKLGAKLEDVEVEMLSHGGVFKKARVKLTLKKEASNGRQVDAPTKKVEPAKIIDKPESRGVNLTPVKEKASAPKPAAVPGEGSSKADTCKTFVEGLLSALGNTATVGVDSTTETHTINIDGEDVGRLIGKGGDALHALQTLVTTIAISNQNGDTRRVYVNVSGYKEKRDETLKALAARKAEYVKKSGRYVKLDPMTPRDRAIVHNALQEIEGVRSYSTGQGNKRQVVIAPPRDEATEGNN